MNPWLPPISVFFVAILAQILPQGGALWSVSDQEVRFAAYDRYKARGVEVLGVTLDNANAEAKIKEVTGQKKMTWSQVYDGGGCKAEIAQLYGIHSIAAPFQVDGDTGEILAIGQACRGEQLEGTIEEALKKKGKQARVAFTGRLRSVM